MNTRITIETVAISLWVGFYSEADPNKIPAALREWPKLDADTRDDWRSQARQVRKAVASSAAPVRVFDGQTGEPEWAGPVDAFIEAYDLEPAHGLEVEALQLGDSLLMRSEACRVIRIERIAS